MTKEEAIEAVEVMISNLPPVFHDDDKLEFHVSIQLAKYLSGEKKKNGDVFYYKGIRCLVS